MRASRAALLLLLLIASGLALAAQEQATQTYVLPLGVYDRDGKFVEGLKPEQIRVKGVKATVKRLELDTGPRRIILLLDMSGSMGQRKTAWEFVRSVTKAVLTAIRPDNSVALHVFAEKHVVLVPFTEDFAAVDSQLDALPRPGRTEAKEAYGRKTALLDALASVMNECEKEFRLGDVIFLISDGGAMRTSEVKIQDLRSRVGRAGVRIFHLVPILPSLATVGDLWVWDLEVAESLAKETGGEILFPWETWEVPVPGGSYPPNYARSENVAATVQKAARLIQSVYRVELEVPESPHKPRKLTVEVLDSHKRRISKERLLDPRYLVPQPAHP